MKLYNKLSSKFVCIGILWCFLSWGAYMNFFSNTSLYRFSTAIVSFSLNIVYKIQNSTVSVFLNNDAGYKKLEIIAFSISMIICIILSLIFSSVAQYIIYKPLLSFRRTKKCEK